MLFKVSKFFQKKAFSLIELLVAVAIILTLLSIASVSYSRYKKSSEKQLVLSNLDMIKSGFETCMKVKIFNKCNTVGKIKVQKPLDATITANSNNSTKKVCFLISFRALKGCVDNSNNQTSKTELDSSSTSTSCSSAGICTP